MKVVHGGGLDVGFHGGQVSLCGLVTPCGLKL
jgi:hypothetical protein